MIEISWVFVSGQRNKINIRVEMKIDSISVMGSKLTWVLRAGSTLTWFQHRDRTWLVSLFGGQNRLRFCVRDENYLVLIYESKLTFLAWGAKLTSFLSAGRKPLLFGVGIDWLSFCAGDRNWIGFSVLAENHLALVWASKLTSLLCGWSKLALFHCRGWNLTWFQSRCRNWLGFDVGVENYFC